MITLSIILIIIAAVLFVLAALNIGAPRFNLGWAGMAFLALSLIVGKV